MEMDRYDHGVPSWVDLTTADLPAAKSFYSGLFGWQMAEASAEAGGYVLAEIDGKPVAGLSPAASAAAPPAWTTYVNVDHADLVAGKVAAAGGHIVVPPTDVLDAGRMALVADPAGALLGLWEARAHPGARLVNEPGTYCWSELLTTDVEGAQRFYESVFGWVPHEAGSGEAPYTEWRVDGRSVAGMMEKPAAVPAEVPPYWGVYFAVSSLDGTVTRITELGGSTVMGPAEVKPGRFAVAADPVGAVFDVIELAVDLGGA